MKLFHLVVSTSISLFLFLAISSIWGSSGIAAYGELLSYRERLTQSVVELQQVQDTISDDLYRVQQDPERLRQEAHRIGMIGETEVRIRLPANLPVTTIQATTMTPKPEPRAASRALITGISLSFGLILFLLLTIFDLESQLGEPSVRRPVRRQTTWYQGIRVQTASRE
jgi:hypothetical protein